MKAIISLLVFSFILIGFIPSDARIIDSEGKNSYVGRFVFDTIPLNLLELANSADRIFTGTCLNVEDIPKDKTSNLHVVKFTFEINEEIKGINGKKVISFKQWAPTTDDAGYEKGRKYVLFLNPNSRLGLTSPVGFLQGHFNVSLDENNKEIVANKVSNLGLHKNLRTKEEVILHDHALSERLNDGGEHANHINYDDFIKSVREVVKN